MPFSEVQTALSEYDKKRGCLERWLFGDEPCINALRKLDPIKQDNEFHIISCFIDRPPESKRSQQFYQTIMQRRCLFKKNVTRPW